MPGNYSESADFLAVVRSCCGREAAHILQATFGGRRITVPLNPKPHHSLSVIVGVSGAEAIRDEFGWGEVNVPLGELGAGAALRVRAQRLLREGLSANDVAKALSISVRTVYRYRAYLTRARSTKDRRR